MTPDQISKLRIRVARQRRDHDEWTYASEDLQRPAKSVAVSCDDLDAILNEIERLHAEVKELQQSAIASQTGDMLKLLCRTLIGSSTDPGAKNYAACHVEWDDGVFSGLNLPFQRIQFALIKPNALSPTEKLAVAEARVTKLEQLAQLVRDMIPDLDDTSGSFSRVDAMNEHVENLAAAVEIMDSGYTQRECNVTLTQEQRDVLGEKFK